MLTEARATRPHRKPIPLGAVLWVVPLLAGPVAWMWTGEWRWCVTGIVVALVTVVLGTVFTPPAR